MDCLYAVKLGRFRQKLGPVLNGCRYSVTLSYSTSAFYFPIVNSICAWNFDFFFLIVQLQRFKVIHTPHIFISIFVILKNTIRSSNLGWTFVFLLKLSYIRSQHLWHKLRVLCRVDILSCRIRPFSCTEMFPSFLKTSRFIHVFLLSWLINNKVFFLFIYLNFFGFIVCRFFSATL